MVFLHNWLIVMGFNSTRKPSGSSTDYIDFIKGPVSCKSVGGSDRFSENENDNFDPPGPYKMKTATPPVRSESKP